VSRDPTGPLAPPLQALLAAERRAPAPPAPRKARVLARLEPMVAAGPGGATEAPPPHGVSTLSSSKLVLLASMACAIGVGGAVAPGHGSAISALASRLPPPVAQAPAPSPVIPPPAPPARTSPHRPSTRKPAAATPDLASLRAEAAILEHARGALAAGDPSAALATLAEAERRFPRAFLLEEREALWIRALAGNGQHEAARARAAAFHRRFPTSIQADAIAGAMRDDVR
jgi:hypothetical protein